jgi:hypothetical protein
MVQENVIQKARHERRQNFWAAFIGIGIAVILFTVIVAVRFSYEPSAQSSDQYDPYYISKKFIIDRLKSPSTAKFPNPYEDDGSVKISLIPGGGDQPQSSRGYRVTSWVDAQNAFGATLRKPWICEVSESSKPGYWKVIGTCGLVE